ncbi:hypothetical protein V1264_008502 [Littorina saxatilis]|uniref:C-type lectin domain-containing protein n=1 Tax=Littorina saxatilis TaxID=31220 RepID=A0AAN9AUJ4_9CAEN
MWTQITVAFLLLNMIGANVENNRTAERHTRGINCPRGWSSFKGHCYIVPYMMGDWEAAKTHCWALRGYLVEITSSKENDFVGKLLLKATPKKSHVSRRDLCDAPEYFARRAWIGLTDRERESSFKWSRCGQRERYTNFRDHQPDNYKSVEHCVEIYNGAYCYPNWSYKWNDESCDSFRAFVCERDFRATP